MFSRVRRFSHHLFEKSPQNVPSDHEKTFPNLKETTILLTNTGKIYLYNNSLLCSKHYAQLVFGKIKELIVDN